ncbi:hypothetical protein [Candidatus Williamhamiltonella defendens]|uniref:hypothetical protein n=1 Tax=Candidatus Williamhamiltonella defendens TaxID=138072 RepID=UPI001E56BBCF|nr:hypothetical protein [Candidatus Hamiltonella defensa]
MKWLILVLGIEYLCKRTGQDGHDAPKEVPFPGRSAGSLKQLALLARLAYMGGVSTVCRCTGKIAIECCPPCTDFWGGSDSRTFFCSDISVSHFTGRQVLASCSSLRAWLSQLELHKQMNTTKDISPKYRAKWQVPAMETPMWLGKQHPYCVVIPVIKEGERIKSLAQTDGGQTHLCD